jgi:hypothetical protein
LQPVAIKLVLVNLRLCKLNTLLQQRVAKVEELLSKKRNIPTMLDSELRWRQADVGSGTEEVVVGNCGFSSCPIL